MQFQRRALGELLKDFNSFMLTYVGLLHLSQNNKKRYLINFINDYSRKTWIYFLVEKSKAFVAFKHYKSFVEEKTGSYIK